MSNLTPSEQKVKREAGNDPNRELANELVGNINFGKNDHRNQAWWQEKVVESATRLIASHVESALKSQLKTIVENIRQKANELEIFTNNNYPDNDDPHRLNNLNRVWAMREIALMIKNKQC